MSKVTSSELDIQQIDEILSLIDSIDAIIQREKDRRPYNMNVIDELHIHADENAHTRILLKLLQYPSNGGYPILSSFLQMASDIMSEVSAEKPMDTVIRHPKISYNQDFIDGLIEGDGQAVIIENKIHYAVDQEAQIERYVDDVVDNHKIKKDKVYVIYLTRNGSKEVQEHSLTSKVKGILGYTKDSTGRFIKMNYRDHIISWLKNDVLPNCTVKEEQLISAIKQYIDHLEGLTLTRKIDKDMDKKIESYLFDSLKVDTRSNEALWNTLTDKCSKLQEVLDAMDNVRKRIADEAYNSLISYSLNALSDITSDSEEWTPCRESTFVQLRNKAWDKHVHFEWWPLSANDLARESAEFKIGFHLEGNYCKAEIRDALYDTLKNVPGLQLYNDPSVKLKHRSALFEKIYNFGSIPFVDASEDKKKEFVYGIINEYTDFILAFKKFAAEGGLTPKKK